MKSNEFCTLTRRNFMLSGTAAGLVYLLSDKHVSAQKIGGTVVMTITPEPNVMLSAFNSASPVAVISSKMVEGLVRYDWELQPQPELATSWHMTDDGLTVTFKLREGVKWHDGKTFTSADVAYSIIELLKKYHPQGRTVFASVESAETPDDHTVILHLSKPAPAMMSALAGWQSPIMPKHIYEGTDPLSNPANNAPVGTGPFRFAQWERGSHIILEKNPDYWDEGKPYLDRLAVRFYADPSTRVAALEAGELHLGGDGPIPLNEVMRFREDPAFVVETRGIEMNNSLDVLECNTRNEFLNKPKVRQALMHAINREQMHGIVWYQLAEILTGPIPQSLPNFYTSDVPSYPFDTEKANALLDMEGLEPNANGIRFSLRLIWPAVGDTYDRAAQFLRQQFRAIGVELQLQSADIPTFIRQVYQEYNFDLSMFPSSVTADPTIGLQRFYHSKAISQGTPFVNASGYSNPDMDKILDAAAIEPNEEARRQLFHQFQQLAMTDLPFLPLARPIYVTVASSNLKNFITGPEGIRSNMASLWLEQ